MVNGSSATGHCSNVDRSRNGFTSICNDPTSSVLFDGVIPTLTGLDGDMWASQLLTLNSTGSIEIAFSFSIFQIVRLRVELVMFNCPEWGISVQSISIRDVDGIVIGSSGDLNSITSCDSLVRLCVPATDINPLVVTVQFDLDTGSNWVHLAEVTIYNDDTTCPPNTTTVNTATTTATAAQMTLPPPTTPTTATTATQKMTTATPNSHITTQQTPTTPNTGTVDLPNSKQ